MLLLYRCENAWIRNVDYLQAKRRGAQAICTGIINEQRIGWICPFRSAYVKKRGWVWLAHAFDV